VLSTLVNIVFMKKVTLAQALASFKTKSALAKAMGVSRAAVSKLKDPLTDRVEARIAVALYRRPDLFPQPQSNQEAQQ
jgi:plasmid maintenance system antidote protein VapI